MKLLPTPPAPVDQSMVSMLMHNIDQIEGSVPIMAMKTCLGAAMTVVELRIRPGAFNDEQT